MVKHKVRAFRREALLTYTSSDSDHSTDEYEEEILPVDNSSEDDEEVVNARDKLKKYGRGWQSVALLHENEDEITGPDKEGDESIDEEIENAAAEVQMDDSSDESDYVPSEYFESSDPGSYRDSTEEDVELRDEALRKKSRFPAYKKQKGIPVFELGMLFDSNAEFKEAITDYAITTRHEIRFTKNEPTRCRAKCVGSVGCPWLIFGSFNKDVDGFQVKTYVPDHSCEPKRGLKRLTQKFLVSKFYDVVAAHPDIKLKYLKSFMEKILELDVNLTLCKRVKKKIVQDLAGNCVKEYGRLRDYAEELLVSNPGTTVSLLTDRDHENDPPRFKAFYCCFQSCKDGFLNGCRPVLGIDGCFLKGLVKGELLAAVGRDGNNQMFPLAWAVVLVENTESWTWFLNLLKHDIGSAEGQGFTLISDRQKGLVGAVVDTWPKAEHRFCCRHLYANWSKTHSGRSLKNKFWNLAKSTNKHDFDKNYKELERANPAAAKDLMLVAPKYWCKAFFNPFSRCDSCDNNLCEAFNGTIVEARSKSIISMLEDIRRAVMRRIRDKRAAVNSWKNDWGPLINKKFQTNVKESFLWVSEWNGGGSFEVKCGRFQYVVRLREGVCSCGAWELSGIPCPHAIRAVHDNGEKAENYINLWYRTPTYMRAYQRPLEPIRGENMWPISDGDAVVPPKLRKMSGRPKKKRRREHNEMVVKHKMSREGRSMTCHVCKGKGHNARSKTCPGRGGSSSQRSEITDLTETPTPTQEGLGSANAPPVSASTRTSGSSNKYVSPFHKENRPKTKPRKSVLTGIGLYINPETGRSILNPGTSMSRVIDRGSKKSKTGSNDKSHPEQ